ncbi:restriction endonuclease subunit S [Clostridium sp. BJN0001]|uniref:restriction endonuclease subunit S n=1 Tax=Clostridium sp. BJN0001 TaxID=2930219 RepID=UPI001FD3F94E|nr:restriction endonuclease subunit S [Clostridium sp. BJN0001]
MKEGYKKTELGWIPREWRVIGTEEILIDEKNSIKIGPFGSQLKKEYLTNSGYKVYGQENVFRNDFNLGDRYIDQERYDLLKSSSLKPGDLVISMMGTVGKTAIIPNDIKKGIMDSHLIRLRVDEKVYNKKLLQQIIQNSTLVKNQIKKLSVGGIMEGLSSTIIKQLKFPLPLLKEQQKIENILSSVDSQIEDADKIIEKTKELKKGLMQRLLTKGIGHKEFKKSEVGEIPKSWDVKELIDISLGKGEYGIGAAATEYENGRPRYLRITDIGDSCDLLMEDIKGVNDEKFSDYLLKENDIVFARTGNTTGKSYVYNKNDGVLVYAGFLIKFSIDPLKCNVKFLKYIVQSKRYWDWVKVMSTRSGQPGINSAEYSKFKIQLPSVSEQNKIEEILSSIDSQIEEYENKRVKLEEVKKGLMQQLLTGKLRVI